MPGYASTRLTETKDRILRLWAERCRKEIAAAGGTTELALSNSLPIYLTHLTKALAENRKMDLRSVFLRDAQAERIGRLHGIDRASQSTYALSEVIAEYHILREVIIGVLEEEVPLTPTARDLILDSIEQAVNDAAVEFTEIHADIQRKFISTLTHDLRTPITYGMAHAEMIQRRNEAGNPDFQSARKIVASYRRLDSMIQDLLDGSRLRAGEKLSFQLEECDLDPLAREVLEELALIHGDRFRLRSPGGVTGAFAKAGVRRALENLLGNAVKYSTPDTPITLTLERTPGSVTIIVHNEGKPIPVGEQAILFEQYRRAKSASESAATGWGLGLTLVKGVAEGHRGQVRVQSEAGRGTSFILELPLRR